MVKILLVQESNWIDRGPHQQHHLMERLATQGHQIRVIDYDILWPTRQPRRILTPRAEYTVRGKVHADTRIQVTRPGLLTLPLAAYLSLPFTHGREIARQLRAFQPDVVIGLGLVNTLIAQRLCRRAQIPFVYYLLDVLHTLIPESWLRPLGRRIERAVIQAADCVVVINEELGRYAQQQGAAPRNLVTCPAGVDLTRMHPQLSGHQVRAALGIAPHDLVLFFMGWLYPFSGITEVATSLLTHQGDVPVRLLVVGRGESYPTLHRLQRQVPGTVLLVDWQTYRDIPHYIAAADICLLPAHNNAVMRNIVPIKMYEYLACGKPVLATPLPGLRREFGHQHGVIYVEQPRDVLPTALALHARGHLAAYGRQGRAFVQRRSWTRITADFHALLTALVARASVPTNS
jgi:glycosyltransferase involved in cell wall biosynthesis